jgi:hypothetical protein
MSKRVAHLFFALALALVAASLQPQAEAFCQENLSSTTTYYGYITDSDGSFYGCTDLIVSPPVPHHWDVVGERYIDCDGNISSWGEQCDNYQVSIQRCPNCQ